MDDDAGFHRVPLRMGLPFEKKARDSGPPLPSSRPSCSSPEA